MNKNKEVKLTKASTKDTFEYQVGSNIITLDGKEKYLDIIIWSDKVTYEDIKDHIV